MKFSECGGVCDITPNEFFCKEDIDNLIDDVETILINRLNKDVSVTNCEIMGNSLNVELVDDTGKTANVTVDIDMKKVKPIKLLTMYSDRIANEAEAQFDTDVDVSLEEKYDIDDWEEEDISLHKRINWPSRNYAEFPVPEDSFEDEVVLYDGSDTPKRKKVKFIKYIRPNEVFPPYYAPEEKAWPALGPMYDGKGKRGKYQIHNRYESQEVYDALSEGVDDMQTTTDSVHDWYITKFPTDSVGQEIPKSVTFTEIYNSMKSGKCNYNYFAYDSIVRERVFERLAQLNDITYDDVYNMWLGCDDEIDLDYEVTAEDMKTSLTEDIDDDVLLPGPETDVARGISDLIISAINDEWNTIRMYNSVIAMCKEEGYEQFIPVIEDINQEENTHIGQLQEMLKQISPNAEAISSGEEEASEQLVDSKPIQDEISVEYDSNGDYEGGLGNLDAYVLID